MEMSKHPHKGPANAFVDDSSEHSSNFICCLDIAGMFYLSLLKKIGILSDFSLFSFWLRKKILILLNQKLKVSSSKTCASPKWL